MASKKELNSPIKPDKTRKVLAANPRTIYGYSRYASEIHTIAGKKDAKKV
jgi:hypothetical protein